MQKKSSRTRAHAREAPLKVTVKRRIEAEGRWAARIEIESNDMMKAAGKQGMSKVKAQAWVYAELDRMYPPLEDVQSAHLGVNPGLQNEKSSQAQRLVVDGQIQGLAAIPEAWSELPANASLSAEVGWVQAKRLRIVTERFGGATVVDLSRALSPAPSWSALGWLETSIRSYAKFVDVAAKATASEEGEASVMSRECLALEEMKAILEEMRTDRDPAS